MSRVKPSTVFLCLLALLGLLAAASCSQEAFSVDSILAFPYIVDGTRQMGLALYAATSIDENKTPLRFDVSSPDGLFKWSLDASPATFEGVCYSGSSDIAMPRGSDLPKGLWSVEIALPDGRVSREEFSIDYKKPAPDAPLPKGPRAEGKEFESLYDPDSGICFLRRK